MRRRVCHFSTRVRGNVHSLLCSNPSHLSAHKTLKSAAGRGVCAGLLRFNASTHAQQRPQLKPHPERRRVASHVGLGPNATCPLFPCRCAVLPHPLQAPAPSRPCCRPRRPCHAPDRACRSRAARRPRPPLWTPQLQPQPPSSQPGPANHGVGRQTTELIAWLGGLPRAGTKAGKVWWECQTCLQNFSGGLSAGLADTWGQRWMARSLTSAVNERTRQ